MSPKGSRNLGNRLQEVEGKEGGVPGPFQPMMRQLGFRGASEEDSGKAVLRAALSQGEP